MAAFRVRICSSSHFENSELRPMEQPKPFDCGAFIDELEDSRNGTLLLFPPNRQCP
jgi:hypothetical protein